MAQVVKVEFTIHDGQKQDPSLSKRRSGRYGTRPASASATRPKNMAPIFQPPTENSNKASSIKIISPLKNASNGNSVVNASNSGFVPLPNSNNSYSNNMNINTSPIAPTTMNNNNSTKNSNNYAQTNYNYNSATNASTSSNRKTANNNTSNNSNNNISNPRMMSGGATTGMLYDHTQSSPNLPDRRLSPEQRTKQQLQNTGTIPTNHHRTNPAKKLFVPEDAFRFSAKPPNLDDLRREQDHKIDAYRLRHPEIYEPATLQPKEPKLQRDNCHHQMSQRLLPRDRSIAPSNRSHLNDPLPFYPFLRENEDHGIHAQRWNVMSVPSDDPERFRPVTTGTASKSHQDFEKWFHPDKHRTMSLASTGRGQDTMTIERADLL